MSLLAPKKRLLIGVTGGSASGKTEIARAAARSAAPPVGAGHGRG